MAFHFVWAIAIMVAGYALQVLMQPKAEKPKPAQLDDFDMPQIKEGTPQSVIFGDCWIPDFQVLYYGHLRSSEIRSSGGKK